MAIRPGSKKTRAGRRGGAAVRESTVKPESRSARKGKVRKEFWLDPRLLREVQDHLGASTEREAVEMALNLVAFRKELGRGARTLRKLALSRID